MKHSNAKKPYKSGKNNNILKKIYIKKRKNEKEKEN